MHPKETPQESLYSSVTVEFKGGEKKRAPEGKERRRRGDETKREERRRDEGVVVKGQVLFRIRSGDSQRSNPIPVGGVLYCIS